MLSSINKKILCILFASLAPSLFILTGRRTVFYKCWQLCSTRVSVTHQHGIKQKQSVNLTLWIPLSPLLFWLSIRTCADWLRYVTTSKLSGRKPSEKKPPRLTSPILSKCIFNTLLVMQSTQNLYLWNIWRQPRSGTTFCFYQNVSLPIFT